MERIKSTIEAYITVQRIATKLSNQVRSEIVEMYGEQGYEKIEDVIIDASMYESQFTQTEKEVAEEICEMLTK